MTSLSSPSTPVPGSNRNLVIAGSVVLFHVVALWTLQSGLLRRAIEIVVPVEILSEIIEPPRPKVVPPPPAPPVPVKQPVIKRTEPVVQPPPQPVAIADPTPAPNAPTGVTTPQPPPPPITAPVAATPQPPAAPPAPPKIELPSSEAEYLQNPKPTYPALSKRMGEQGKVIVRVQIGVDGTPLKAELKKSSGFDRLDKSALEYVMKCRYVAGKVAGVAQTMWYDAPVNFVLE
ncbi:MAG TPA: energy transducer TonB [Burkholderiaceae bacterium]|nr:energy transducer TonB [Burkholderiaceae bacterium]